jgi:hypothetical protein
MKTEVWSKELQKPMLLLAHKREGLVEDPCNAESGHKGMASADKWAMLEHGAGEGIVAEKGPEPVTIEAFAQGQDSKCSAVAAVGIIGQSDSGNRELWSHLIVIVMVRLRCKERPDRCPNIPCVTPDIF